MLYLIIVIAITTVIALSLTYNPFIRFVAERKAIPILDEVLFREEKVSKEDILHLVHKLTNYRFSDQVLLDYFYKIKGLQVIHNPSNFWLKKYLSTPTKVKLNYFEQVRFYKTFLNYSEQKNERQTNNDILNSIEQTVELKLKTATVKPGLRCQY